MAQATHDSMQRYRWVPLNFYWSPESDQLTYLVDQGKAGDLINCKHNGWF